MEEAYNENFQSSTWSKFKDKKQVVKPVAANMNSKDKISLMEHTQTLPKIMLLIFAWIKLTKQKLCNKRSVHPKNHFLTQ